MRSCLLFSPHFFRWLSSCSVAISIWISITAIRSHTNWCACSTVKRLPVVIVAVWLQYSQHSFSVWWLKMFIALFFFLGTAAPSPLLPSRSDWLLENVLCFFTYKHLRAFECPHLRTFLPPRSCDSWDRFNSAAVQRKRSSNTNYSHLEQAQCRLQANCGASHELVFSQDATFVIIKT